MLRTVRELLRIAATRVEHRLIEVTSPFSDLDLLVKEPPAGWLRHKATHVLMWGLNIVTMAAWTHPTDGSMGQFDAVRITACLRSWRRVPLEVRRQCAAFLSAHGYPQEAAQLLAFAESLPWVPVPMRCVWCVHCLPTESPDPLSSPLLKFIQT